MLDIWLKTPLLTFNRTFPHEINRFVPALCSPPELADHIRFASLFGLSHDFRASYLAGFEDREAIAAMDILAAADEVVSTGDYVTETRGVAPPSTAGKSGA